MKVVRLSAVHTSRLYSPGIVPDTFLLKAESIAGPCCGRKDYVNKKFY
jgi:hypothetical protein